MFFDLEECCGCLARGCGVRPCGGGVGFSISPLGRVIRKEQRDLGMDIPYNTVCIWTMVVKDILILMIDLVRLASFVAEFMEDLFDGILD
jgi:hypothetical protein